MSRNSVPYFYSPNVPIFLRHCEIMERNNQIVSESSIVMMEIRVSIERGVGDVFEHENCKRKFVEIIYSKYIHIFEEVTSVCIKRKGVHSSNNFFL